MKTWITPDGNYYVGMFVAEGSVEVPERPSESHQWIDSTWVFVRPVPQSVTRFQARTALLNKPSLHEGVGNMLDEVEVFMASGQADPLARLAWTDAQEFKRTSPTIQALAPLLDLSGEDLDQLFTAAAGIDA